ncbi:MAG: TIM barrel protein [Planctomycetota bacterium]
MGLTPKETKPMADVKVAVRLDGLMRPGPVNPALMRKTLAKAASMGVQAVELCGRKCVPVSDLSDTAVRSLRKMLDDLNLRVAAIRFQTRQGYDRLEGLERRVDATKQAMRAAYRLGAPVVVNQIGKVPAPPEKSASEAKPLLGLDAEARDPTSGGAEASLRRIELAGAGDLAAMEHFAKGLGTEGPSEAWDTLQSVVADLGKFGAHVGANLAAETGTEPGADLAALLRSVDDAYLPVTLNPGKLIVNQFSVSDAIDALSDRIQLVAAVDGVMDLAAGRGITVPVGQGTTDFPWLLGRLEDIPYRGDFVIGRDAMSPSTAESEMQQGVDYLRNL